VETGGVALSSFTGFVFFEHTTSQLALPNCVHFFPLFDFSPWQSGNPLPLFCIFFGPIFAPGPPQVVRLFLFPPTQSFPKFFSQGIIGPGHGILNVDCPAELLHLVFSLLSYSRVFFCLSKLKKFPGWDEALYSLLSR